MAIGQVDHCMSLTVIPTFQRAAKLEQEILEIWGGEKFLQKGKSKEASDLLPQF